MPGLRRRILSITIALAALSACAPGGQDGLGPDVRRGLEQGRDAAASWIADGRTSTDVAPSTAIALGYLERLRLGLGSPFRLIDYALADPRLENETRRTLAWSLLARTLDRAAYQINPAALDRAGLGEIETLPAVGYHHLDLIEGAVRESPEPRSGELAVRLAYALAAAEGSLPARAPELAARAAALVRDRELASNDALRLLRAAEDEAQDPLRLMTLWRAERRFQVEEPPMVVLPQASELYAMELAPRLARGLRELSLQVDQIRSSRARALTGPTGLLSHAAALELSAVADSFNAPPQAPVGIAARMYRRELLEQPTLSDEQREQRAAFMERSTSEERFVAEHALLRSRSQYDIGPALTVLAAATALRPFAQEPVWFPGFGGPTTRELEERYGVAVRFGDDVPAQWRPYYRRMLDIALTDMYRVLPALDLHGLSVLFANQAEPGATLAMHDPKHRRLLLPPGTTAGTIAHEVAHDLDWQVALRRYRVRGDYATDRAARSRTDRLALRLQDLANGSLDPNASGSRLSTHARRPAEVFARNVDWFVAVSLAAQGRVNGYLSSVQDDLLTGYGTVRPPDVSGTAGEAIIDILDEVAPLYPATRQWFLKSYGLSRALTPYDLARRVLEGAMPEEPTQPRYTELATPTQASLQFTGIEQARQAGFAAIDAWICRSPGAAYNSDLERARRELVMAAAAARARGLARAEAKNLAGREGAQWVARDLFGAQWPTIMLDSTIVDVLTPVAAAARDVNKSEVVRRTERFDLVRPPEGCAAAPLRVY
jgi:hypothetical protein